jgi:putative transposase
VVDNYIIHKSHKVARWLAKNSKFRLLADLFAVA